MKAETIFDVEWLPKRYLFNILVYFNLLSTLFGTTVQKDMRMSAYAAGVMDKKTSSKNRRSKTGTGCRTKQSILPPMKEDTISGLSIRRKTFRIALFCLEAYLTLVFGFFVIFYVYGRRLLSTRSLCSSENKLRNPYSALGKTTPRTNSKSYKDSSCPINSNSDDGDGGIKVKPPQCLEDPILGMHKFIKIQGVKLHYVEAGGGRGRPVLLLVHGACDFWFTWRLLVPALSRRFRVVCLDMRGCGDSDKPLLRSSYSMDQLAGDVAGLVRVLDQQDGRKGVSLVGTGWGGQVCWRVAEVYPGLVRKMVLIHSPHPYVMHAHCMSSIKTLYKQWPLLFVRLPGLPEWAAAEGNLSLVSKLLAPLVEAKAISEEEIAAYFYNFSRPEDITGSLHHVRNWKLFGCSPTTPPVTISTPTLLLMGDSDPNLPLDAGYKSAEYVERIKTRVLLGAAEWAAVTHPMAVLEELASFFSEPRILETSYTSSEDWDEDEEDEEVDEGVGRETTSLVRRMVGAGLSVVTRLTPDRLVTGQ